MLSRNTNDVSKIRELQQRKEEQKGILNAYRKLINENIRDNVLPRAEMEVQQKLDAWRQKYRPSMRGSHAWETANERLLAVVGAFAGYERQTDRSDQKEQKEFYETLKIAAAQLRKYMWRGDSDEAKADYSLRLLADTYTDLKNEEAEKRSRQEELPENKKKVLEVLDQLKDAEIVKEPPSQTNLLVSGAIDSIRAHQERQVKIQEIRPQRGIASNDESASDQQTKIDKLELHKEFFSAGKSASHIYLHNIPKYSPKDPLYKEIYECIGQIKSDIDSIKDYLTYSSVSKPNDSIERLRIIVRSRENGDLERAYWPDRDTQHKVASYTRLLTQEMLNKLNYV